jgi:toxin ParE1/3/4
VVDARREVIWAPTAQAHLQQAASYIAQDSVVASARLVQLAIERSGSLQTMAGRGRIVPELGIKSLRELFVKPYRLIYRISDRHVYIVAFIHGSRDFASWAAEIDSGSAG